MTYFVVLMLNQDMLCNRIQVCQTLCFDMGSGLVCWIGHCTVQHLHKQHIWFVLPNREASLLSACVMHQNHVGELGSAVGCRQLKVHILQ